MKTSGTKRDRAQSQGSFDLAFEKRLYLEQYHYIDLTKENELRIIQGKVETNRNEQEFDLYPLPNRKRKGTGKTLKRER